MRRTIWGAGLGMAMLAGCGGGGTFETVSIDPSGRFPVEAAGIEVISVHMHHRGALRTGQVQIRNPGGHAAVWVKANWYTAGGERVPDPKETQREVVLAPGEETSLFFAAPRTDAEFLRIQIRRGSKRPR